MRWSIAQLHTLKETPADAEIPSHQLMVRGGYIKKVAPGIYTYGPLALKAIRRFESIVRQELDQRGSVEILMPMVQPKELWDETGRWQAMGPDLLKFKNRNEHEWCLGATHEEVVTDYVRKDLKSYRDLPVTLYQIQTKYRDEIRPRFGLMRGREFIMKDAYSFDLDRAGAQRSYELMYEAYRAIFARLDLDFRVVQADSGAIGGNQSQEFHVLAGSGEDHLLVSEDGEFAANVEICPARDAKPEVRQANLVAYEKFATPRAKTIDDLAKLTGVPARGLVKTLFYSATEPGDSKVVPIAVLLRGSDELNPIKLKNLLGLKQPPLMLNDREVREVTGASPGSCGPVGLKIPIYMDTGVEPMTNYIVGANVDEFHLRNVNHGRDYTPTRVADLRVAREGDASPTGRGVLKSYRGIEVGHIFYLGTKYSDAMKLSFLNTEGKPTTVEMGCYGIGITRTVQAAIEQSHDADGIVWPVSLAPFPVHICLLDPKDEKVARVAEEIYRQLASQGVECLLDDRDERPGVKFKDADLLGMPLRINVGGRGVAAGEVEIVLRKTKAMTKIPIVQAASHVFNWYAGEKK